MLVPIPTIYILSNECIGEYCVTKKLKGFNVLRRKHALPALSLDIFLVRLGHRYIADKLRRG